MEREIQKLVLQSGRIPFDEWFDSLRDWKMQAGVDARLTGVRAGNFGDCKSVGGGCLSCGSRWGLACAFTTDCAARKW